MAKLLFSLPWGRAISKQVLVKTPKGIQYQTDATFRGNGTKYAQEFLNSNKSNATELLVRADKSLLYLPNDPFWTDVQRAALKALKSKEK